MIVLQLTSREATDLIDALRCSEDDSRAMECHMVANAERVLRHRLERLRTVEDRKQADDGDTHE